MANFIDYIKWRGDLSFRQTGLNEVDALIFDEMVYLELETIVGGLDPDTAPALDPAPALNPFPTLESELAPGDDLAPDSAPGSVSDVASKTAVTLADAYKKYRELGIDQSHLSNDPAPLVAEMAGSERFGKVTLKYYVNDIDKEKEVQFAALTIFLGDGSLYVAFRGTDNTLVGWREDFNLSYKNETAGQAAAVRYLNAVMERTEGRVYVGGHSKGGNLAVYAAAFCEEKYKGRICEIFSNDGPGMNRSIAERREYQEILDKVRLSIPQSSLVGILFSNTKKKKIVKSDVIGGSAQHNPYTWQVMGNHFEEVDAQSEESIFLNGTLNEWLDQMDAKKKEEFTRTVFDTLETSGANTFSEINSNKWVSYNAILKAAFKLDPESQKIVRDALKELAIISRDAFWDEAQKSFARFKV